MRRNGMNHCQTCANAKNNMNRTLDDLEKLEASKSKHALGSSSSIQNSVAKLFKSKLEEKGNLYDAIAAFLDDADVIECMTVLSLRNKDDIVVERSGGHKMRIFTCSADDCTQIMVKEYRESNAQNCISCRNKSRNNRVSEETRQKNYDKQTAPNSKTPYSCLNDEKRNIRHSRNNNVKASKNRKIRTLEMRLATLKKKFNEAEELTLDGSDGINFLRTDDDTAATRSTAQRPNQDDTDEEGNSKHDLFMKDIRQIFSQVSNNRKQYAEYARLAVVELLREGVEAEKSGKSEYEFDPKDQKIDEMVTFMMEQITNTFKQLNEKKRQVRYTPMTMQLCYAMWSRSPAGYREMKSLSPLVLPCERQLQNLKQANRVKDGRDIKTYQMRAATRGLDRKSEFGYLMTDEMKLKHGVLWNSQTGEACGLADDMLELNVFLKRLLSDEGDVVKPAVYVNQWRYISIRAGKPEGWNCGFFYNDGSLTGGTLLRQFDHVTVCCESIGSKVYGLVLDAGGNNAKFVSRLRNDKKLDDETTWIDEELCYTPNPVDPTRRIYTWFCMTHLLKAMRNQLFASQQDWSKSFVDEHGTNFGWTFIVKLNQVLQDEKMGDNNLKRNVRLNDKSTNPTSYRKMSVSDAKIPFETKTLSFAEEQICKVLGIDKHLMESEVKKRLEINNNPPIQLGNSAGANKNRRHGYHLEKAKFIYEMILECEKAGDRIPITNAHHRAIESMQVDYSFVDEDDTEMAELDLTEIDLGTNEDRPEHATAIIDEIEASIPSKDDASKKKRPPPAQPKHTQINSETHSEASTLLFMSHINAIFHDMVLNKNEKLNNDNIDEYKRFLQQTMTYFGDMKIEQLNRRANGEKDWERHFLDRVTWRNLRGGLCPFIYILRELPSEIDGLTFVPMLFSNQSPLESQFSAIRASKHDNATTYAAEITNKNIRQAKTAVNNGGAYNADDCPEEEDVTTVTGVAALSKYMKESTLKLDTWKKKRNDMKDNNSETNNEQNNIDKLFESNKLEELANKMNTHIDTVGFVDKLVANTYFQQWFLLSVDNPDRMKWFDNLLSVDDVAFDRVCRSILLTLFALMEDAMTSDDDRCYEKLFRDYLVVKSDVGEEPSDFDMLVQIDLPTIQLQNNRLCAIYLVEVLKTMLDDCVYKSVKEMAPKPSDQPPVQIDTSSDLFLASMQQMVGSGIRAAKLDYCPTRSDKDEAWELFNELYFEHDTTTPPSQEYVPYYPRQIEFANSGGLHLIQLDLIPWSIDMFKFIMESYLDENIAMNRREYIAISLTKLRNDKVLYAKFKEIIDNQGIDFSNDTLLEKIHLRIAEFAFRAYTKQKNNDKFNKIKSLASDKTNLAFRTQVQTGGKDRTEELVAKDTTTTTATTSNQELAQKLGMKTKTTKRKRTPQEVEIKKREEYKTHYEKALGKFEKHNTNNPKDAKLTMKECAAVLTIGFEDYINDQGQKKQVIVNKVQKEIDKGVSSKPFWARRQSSKKQRVDEQPPTEPPNPS